MPAQNFDVRNMPYINQDDPRYHEAISDIINQVSSLKQQVVTLQAQVKALGG